MPSKRLGRKRYCYATPDRYLGDVPSHNLRFALLKKSASPSSKDRGFWRDPRAWSVSNEKIEYTQRRRLRREINSTSKSEVFPTWAPLPNPKEMKAILSKVQASKFILQNGASKLRFFQTSILKFYLLSPISALLLPTCSSSSFQKLVEEVQNYIIWVPYIYPPFYDFLQKWRGLSVETLIKNHKGTPL